MKEQFINWNPSQKSIALLDHIDNILASYEEQGYKLTLRQLYYQLVASDIIPNNISEYNKIGNVVNKGRLAGYIDWDMIEDRVRIPKTNSHWNTPKDILESAANSFYMDRWVGQDTYIEVLCEKDAVSNILEPICRKWDVLFMANRGYSSTSAVYEMGKRMKWTNKMHKVIIYLGDHDPSGIDMTRDVKERVNQFITSDFDVVDMNRIALNMDQVDEYNPPENPAKSSDSRYETYVGKFGNSSWELDALEPSVLAGILEGQIIQYVDMIKFDIIAEQEQEYKQQIREIAENFGE